MKNKKISMNLTVETKINERSYLQSSDLT
jgi:hypothetical protein